MNISIYILTVTTIVFVTVIDIVRHCMRLLQSGQVSNFLNHFSKLIAKRFDLKLIPKSLRFVELCVAMNWEMSQILAILI